MDNKNTSKYFDCSIDCQQPDNKLKIESNVQEARRAVSRNGINLAAFLLSANVVALAIEVVLLLAFIIFKAFNGITDATEIKQSLNDLLTSQRFLGIFSGLLNIVSMYLVAFPIFCLMGIDMKRRKYETGGLSAARFLMLIPIAMLLMYVGSYLGEALNAIVSSIIDSNISNATIESIERMPLWLMIPMTMVFAPIVEEFMFRRTLIGTLGRYGNIFAIIISSVVFGLFHGNMYQFFYCFLLGILLGYVYVKSGNWWLSVLMHSILNFIGGVLPKITEKLSARYTELTTLAEAGEAVNKIEMFFANAAIKGYNLFLLILFIAGIALTVMAIAKKWYKIENNAEIEIPREYVPKVVFGNVGATVFTIFTVITFAISIFTT